jgi:hypothetical protein
MMVEIKSTGTGNTMVEFFVCRHFHQGLHEAQLQRRWMRFQYPRCIGEFLRCLEFAFCGNDFRAAQTLCLCLFCHGTLHLRRQVNVFYFHNGDLDSPGIRALVQNGLQLRVDFFPLRKDLVQFRFAHDTSESCLSKL